MKTKQKKYWETGANPTQFKLVGVLRNYSPVLNPAGWVGPSRVQAENQRSNRGLVWQLGWECPDPNCTDFKKHRELLLLCHALEGDLKSKQKPGQHFPSKSLLIAAKINHWKLDIKSFSQNGSPATRGRGCGTPEGPFCNLLHVLSEQ